MNAAGRIDHYAGTAAGWAAAASRVYGPLAVELVARSPHPLGGRLVLDGRARRPPRVVADIHRLPLAAGSVDDAIAPFVLNHLDRPDRALAELAWAVRLGGAVLASVYDNASSSPPRDRVDQVAAELGHVVPDWYQRLKVTSQARDGTVDLLPSPPRPAWTACACTASGSTSACTGPRTWSTTGTARPSTPPGCGP